MTRLRAGSPGKFLVFLLVVAVVFAYIAAKWDEFSQQSALQDAGFGVTVAQARIAQRGREFERNITSDYLQQLNALYETWLDGFDLCPVLTIPTDDLDFVDDQANLHRIATYILDRLQGKDVLSLH